jgi:phosphate-selective porin OprO/OprP
MPRVALSLLLTALATAFGQSVPDSSQAPGSPVGERLEDVESQVKILKRLRENDIEDAAAIAAAAPRIQADGSGFWIRSADSSYQFRPRVIARLGANWDLDDKNNVTLDNFQAQTVRIGFDATLARVVDGKVIIDLSKGNAASLQYGYVDLKYAPWLVARFGKSGVPLAWERNQSSSDLLFFDRALPSQIAPDVDVGGELWGKIGGGVVEYGLGVFDGASDGSKNDKDVNDDKDLYGRLWLVPGKTSGNPWIEGLGFGAGGSIGYHSNSFGAYTLASYKTTAGNTFFSWNTADSAQGVGWRVTPQLSWTAGSFWIYGEWIRSTEILYKGSVSTSKDSVVPSGANKGEVIRSVKTAAGAPGIQLGADAWQAAVSWVVTGEDANPTGVKPRHPFGPDGWGALELSARISGLAVDDNAFHGAVYADSTKSARSALEYGVAANWHLVKGSRLQVGYERTQFEYGALTASKTVRDRKPENQLFVLASTAF